MADARDTLLLPFERGDLPEPTVDAPWAFLNATPLQANAFSDALICRQRDRGVHLDLEAAGYKSEPYGALPPVAGAIVLANRHRAINEMNIVRATNAVGPGGRVLVVGDKSMGIAPLRNYAGQRVAITDSLSKHHAIAFHFTVDAPFAPLAEPPRVEGFEVYHGVFSAKKVDTGSRVLADQFSPRIKGRVADFGAGWGYLASRLMADGAPEAVELFEADHAALACARTNVPDARATFHWCDLTREPPRGPFDWVIMNPPFHDGGRAQGARKGGAPVRSLGEAFIANAARCLPQGGRLLMVANTHLAYEQTLATHFRRHVEIARERGFKVIEATR